VRDPTGRFLNTEQNGADLRSAVERTRDRLEVIVDELLELEDEVQTMGDAPKTVWRYLLSGKAEAAA